MYKRQKWVGAALAALLFAVTPAANAQQFPAGGPITLIVPYPPGGLSDFFARIFAPKFAELAGVPVVVDNKPGANGAIGTNLAARSKPDGNTIALVPASTVTSNQWLMKDLPFDPQKDLTPLGITLVVPNVLVVNPSVPASDVPQLLELIRKNPGKMNFASVGVGSSPHLQGEMMKMMAKVDMVHIAYKGAGPAIQDLVAGQVQLMFDNLPAVLPKLQANQLRPLAVTSAKSAPQLPDVPPIGKFLPGFEATPWFGLVGPAGMHKDTITKMNELIVRAANSADVKTQLEARGGEILTSTSQEMAQRIRDDAERMRVLIKDANIKID